MKFKIASGILILFTLIGLAVVIFSNFYSTTSLMVCIGLYVLIPAYGAYGTLVKHPIAIFVAMLFFIFQSIRSVGVNSLIPNISPITLSFPLSDFSNGQGYLIDYFAIFMSVYLACLFKIVILAKKQELQVAK